jgi:two-component system, NtrC family, response regulator
MGKKAKIWVVDDEKIIRVTLADDLRDAGYAVREFSNAGSVFQILPEETPDIIITDLKMPGIDGIELLAKIKQIKPEITIIVMTAYGTVENAVKAMKLGAYDYMTKPFDKEEVLLMLDRIMEVNSIRKENKILRKKIGKQYDFSSYVGDLELNNELFELLQMVADKDSTVLVTGETGTGKELITNILHYNSCRKGKTLVKVSCAILSREIFESELFGHVKGAFTGAESDKMGRFEMANGGTLYLDDIDDIPYDLQVKLLRALEEREIERVGSSKTIPIDVRVIASTKKDLRKLASEGKFREDLFYRLNVFPINLTPLRERKKDIPKILEYYLNQYANGTRFKIDPSALQCLVDYHWPGNVRELKNIAERLTIIVGDGKISLSDIPLEVRNNENIEFSQFTLNKPLNALLAEVEFLALQAALEKSKYNKSKAAELLKIPPSTPRTTLDTSNME